MPLDHRAHWQNSWILLETSRCLVGNVIDKVYFPLDILLNNREDLEDFIAHLVWVLEDQTKEQQHPVFCRLLCSARVAQMQKQGLAATEAGSLVGAVTSVLLASYLQHCKYRTTMSSASSKWKILKFRSMVVLVLWKLQYQSNFIFSVLIFLIWCWGGSLQMGSIVFKIISPVTSLVLFKMQWWGEEKKRISLKNN